MIRSSWYEFNPVVKILCRPGTTLNKAGADAICLVATRIRLVTLLIEPGVNPIRLVTNPIRSRANSNEVGADSLRIAATRIRFVTLSIKPGENPIRLGITLIRLGTNVTRPEVDAWRVGADEW